MQSYDFRTFVNQLDELCIDETVRRHLRLDKSVGSDAEQDEDYHLRRFSRNDDKFATEILFESYSNLFQEDLCKSLYITY